MSTPIPEEKMVVLADLISRGKKIEAIALYRELTGLGLKEAKNEIDALEVSLAGGTQGRRAADPEGERMPGAIAPLPADKMTALSALIFQRRKIEAIKLYREWTGLGLKEAKDQVEAWEASLRAKSPEKFAAAPQR